MSFFDLLPASDSLGKYREWFARTGPTLPEAILNGMADAGRMMTTPPPSLPAGASFNDAGNVVFMRNGREVPWFDVDPAASRAYGE
jgi:hypothetical protein